MEFLCNCSDDNHTNGSDHERNNAKPCGDSHKSAGIKQKPAGAQLWIRCADFADGLVLGSKYHTVKPVSHGV